MNKPNNIYMTDSYSDGMCGWVELLNKDTGKKHRTHWSITDKKFTSQSQAITQASKVLSE